MKSIRSTVQVLGKSLRGQGLHMGHITRLHSQAMELCGKPGYGVPSFYLAYSIIVTAGVAYYLRDSLFDLYKSIANGDSSAYAWFVVALLIYSPLILTAAYFTLFTPSEAPLIFDRKSQKVYWASRKNNWRRFVFKPAVMRSYDWSHVEAEHQTSPMAVGNNISLMHHLAFVVRGADGKLFDEYVISHIIDPVPALWNYVNGYMNGQVNPKPKDVAPGNGVVYGYWDILSAQFPWLDWKHFGKRFREAPGFVLLLCLAAPVMLVWSPVFMFTKLLADLTRQRLLWPQEILSAIGPATRAMDPITDIQNPDARYKREVLDTHATHAVQAAEQARRK